MEEVVIIGGGVAGLSCLNALLAKGVSPLLVEAATIGTPKMCGEFIAPVSSARLQQWDIGPIQTVATARFFSKNHSLTLPFIPAAGAIARDQVELQLAQRARFHGGRIRENTPIQHIIPATANTPYQFSLPQGEMITAKTAIFATGKWGTSPVSSSTPLPYYGIKLHLPFVVVPETLLMFAVTGAYFGVVPLAGDRSNCACLARREAVEKIGSPQQFLHELLMKQPLLAERITTHDLANATWLVGKAPEFRQRQHPVWPRSYWLGDALASLPPAIGSGLTHGISSALLAAEYYWRDDPQGYQRVSQQQIKSKLAIGKILHQLLLQPNLSSWVLPLLQTTPWLTQWLLKKLDFCS